MTELTKEIKGDGSTFEIQLLFVSLILSRMINRIKTDLTFVAREDEDEDGNVVIKIKTDFVSLDFVVKDTCLEGNYLLVRCDETDIYNRYGFDPSSTIIYKGILRLDMFTLHKILLTETYKALES
jgi:hypothetical protein